MTVQAPTRGGDRHTHRLGGMMTFTCPCLLQLCHKVFLKYLSGDMSDTSITDYLPVYLFSTYHSLRLLSHLYTHYRNQPFILCSFHVSKPFQNTSFDHSRHISLYTTSILKVVQLLSLQLFLFSSLHTAPLLNIKEGTNTSSWKLFMTSKVIFQSWTIRLSSPSALW